MTATATWKTDDIAVQRLRSSYHPLEPWFFEIAASAILECDSSRPADDPLASSPIVAGGCPRSRSMIRNVWSGWTLPSRSQRTRSGARSPPAGMRKKRPFADNVATGRTRPDSAVRDPVTEVSLAARSDRSGDEQRTRKFGLCCPRSADGAGTAKSGLRAVGDEAGSRETCFATIILSG
jgi:hypothetical protein